MPRRRAQLVCQHLENVSRRFVEEYPDVFRALVRGRHRHGVYALYRGQRLCYVGLATNLRGRLKQHLRDRHAQTWDRFSLYLTVGDRHLREIESLLLRISKPTGNVQTSTFAKSENLLLSVRRQIKEQQRVDLDDIAPRVAPKMKKADVKAARKPPKPKGRQPALAKYVSKPFPIRFRFKAKLYTARVRKDGTIRFAGKVYNSPSAAASSVAKGAVDGWHAWRYQRAPGDWVKLDELRK